MNVAILSIKRELRMGSRWGLAAADVVRIADSPVGLAAYFLDHDARSYDLNPSVF